MNDSLKILVNINSNSVLKNTFFKNYVKVDGIFISGFVCSC